MEKYIKLNKVEFRALRKVAKRFLKSLKNKPKPKKVPGAGKEYFRNYQKAFRDKYAGYSAKRHSDKLLRTPKWLKTEDFDKMDCFYTEAAILTNETGIKYQVDHIIPLRGKLISGLHVPSNLQVLTKVRNNKKLNKWPYDW